MSRELESALAAEMQASSLRPVLLVEGEFDSGALRFWSGLGDLVTMGKTFMGAGHLLSVSDYTETQRLEAQGLSITLSAISSSIVSVSLQEQYQGRPCHVYIGALNDAGVLVSEPYQLFSGYMDTLDLVLHGETCTVTINAENKLLMLNRTKERRYTAEDQKGEYPNDTGFDFVTALQDKEVIWKAKS